MRTPVSITHNAEASLKAEICLALAERGYATAQVDGLGVTVDVWRKVARAAARELGRPVQTLEGRGAVHAVLRDWPSNSEEQDRHNRAMRAAVDSVAWSPLSR